MADVAVGREVFGSGEVDVSMAEATLDAFLQLLGYVVAGG